MSPLLEIAGVWSGYGKGDIVRGVDMVIGEGEIVTVIGPNGAGKSTLVRTVAGVIPAREGVVRLQGEVISDLRASDIARRGVAYVPQEANIFRTLTVLENLEMGAWVLPEKRAERLELVLSMFPALHARQRQRAGALSGGERQMVAFGMALMVDPRVLLLDEPSAGLSPRLVHAMFETIAGVNRRGVAVLLVEQNAVRALQMSHRGYVMASGQVKFADSAAEILRNREVAELYLGVSA